MKREQLGQADRKDGGGNEKREGYVLTFDWRKYFPSKDKYRAWQERLRELAQHSKTTSAGIGDYSLINALIDTSWAMPSPWHELNKSRAGALWKGGECNDDA